MYQSLPELANIATWPGSNPKSSSKSCSNGFWTKPPVPGMGTNPELRM
jgi:hypothetical protein